MWKFANAEIYIFTDADYLWQECQGFKLTTTKFKLVDYFANEAILMDDDEYPTYYYKLNSSHMYKGETIRNINTFVTDGTWLNGDYQLK